MTAHPEHPLGSGHHPGPHGRHLRAERILVGAIAALVVLGGAGVLAARLQRVHRVRDERARLEADRDEGEVITVSRVVTTDAARTVTLPGDVRGYNQATLYAKVSGYVREVRVQRGQRVRKGDVLATIDSPENEQQVIQAQHDEGLARLNSRRFQSLAPSGVVSAQDRDTAVTQAHVARAALAQARAILSYTVVRAPFDGIVSARYVDPGALVPAATAGTQSAMPIVDVADTSVVRVFAYVGQDVAPFVQPGDAVVVWQDELPDRRIPGPITFVTGVLDERTRTMQVEVDLPNEGWKLLPGTFVHVEIDVREPPAPLVPDDAILVRDGKTEVALVAGGRAHFVDVDLGYNDGSKVRVLHGLQGGETVGTSVPLEVQEGARVRVAEGARDGGASAAGPAGAVDGGSVDAGAGRD